MNDQIEIIPFGKYKGQPIEVLQSDKQYMEWIMTQDWFVQKYPSIRTLIVNNFNTPTDSPEHNTLVANFVSDDFCMKFFKFLKARSVNENIKFPEVGKFDGKDYPLTYTSEPYYVIEKVFEMKDGSDIGVCITLKRDYKITIPDYSVPAKQYVLNDNDSLPPVFEQQTKERNDYYNLWYDVAIECKPVVGDDYPSVIRQCRAQHSNVLFIGEFTSRVTTIDILRQMFSDIKIVLMSDII